MKKSIRHLLSISDLSEQDIETILSASVRLKRNYKKIGRNEHYLKNKTLGMIFEKPSLRTRVSFESGMTQLGGHAIYLAPSDIGLGKRESIKDVSRVMSRMVDIIMARTFYHSTIEEYIKYSDIPVINGLSNLEHPCQILADLLTIKEKKRNLRGLKVAFIGDGENNVTHSLVLASAILGIELRVATPKLFRVSAKISKMAKLLGQKKKSLIVETINPKEAVYGADVVYTDTWVSMGDENEKEKRIKLFKGYQVNKSLMSLAKSNAVFMHDMPAYRGFEVTEEIIDGDQSIVIDQAENRLHAQKALMCFLLGISV